MNDTLRYIIAGALIFLIIILQPFYLEWLGYDAGPSSNEDSGGVNSENINLPVQEKSPKPSFEIKPGEIAANGYGKESFITIVTPMYTATLTNNSGGSFVNYFLTGENSDKLKYLGGYDDGGLFQPDIPVSLIINSEENCMPCLADCWALIASRCFCYRTGICHRKRGSGHWQAQSPFISASSEALGAILSIYLYGG